MSGLSKANHAEIASTWLDGTQDALPKSSPEQRLPNTETHQRRLEQSSCGIRSYTVELYLPSHLIVSDFVPGNPQLSGCHPEPPSSVLTVTDLQQLSLLAQISFAFFFASSHESAMNLSRLVSELSRFPGPPLSSSSVDGAPGIRCSGGILSLVGLLSQPTKWPAEQLPPNLNL